MMVEKNQARGLGRRVQEASHDGNRVPAMIMKLRRPAQISFRFIRRSIQPSAKLQIEMRSVRNAAVGVV